MTSKEAIHKIDLTIKYGSMTQDELNSYLEYKNIIEKDLEVLEILKPMLEVKKGSSWWYLDIKHCFFDSQEHIDLIKRWLENDRTRI